MSEVKRPHDKRRVRWALRMGLALAIAALVVFLVIWRQDRPLTVAETRLAAGSPEQALAIVDDFLADHPGHGAALALRGRTLVELRRWDEALESFDQGGAATPDDTRAWATALLHQQRWSDALPLLERLDAADGADAQVLKDLVACQYQLGYANAALNSAARLAALPGNEAAGRFQEGVIRRALNDTSQCIDCWTRFLELNPTAENLPITPEEFFLAYSQELLREGRPRAAQENLQKSVNLRPTAPALAALGESWTLIGDHTQAAAAWNEALQLDPNNRAAREGLAEIDLARSDAMSAIEWLAPISGSDSVQSSTAYLMQRAATLQGDEQAATRWQLRTAELRKSEKLRAALERRLKNER